MKTWHVSLIAALALHSASAQLISPASVGGALWGTVIGGAVGADRCGGWSGSGAAIGAGVGFVAGTLVNSSQPAAWQNSYYATATVPPYGYYGHAYPAPPVAPVVASSAPTQPAPAAARPVFMAPAPSGPRCQIADAPRVPDAPTF